MKHRIILITLLLFNLPGIVFAMKTKDSSAETKKKSEEILAEYQFDYSFDDDQDYQEIKDLCKFGDSQEKIEAFLLAAYDGHVGKLHYCLNHGVEINSSINKKVMDGPCKKGQTALTYAVLNCENSHTVAYLMRQK